MTEEELQKIADEATMIVDGYAFKECEDGFVHVLNLYHPEEICILDRDGNPVSTTANYWGTMLIQAYYATNKEFMGDEMEDE